MTGGATETQRRAGSLLPAVSLRLGFEDINRRKIAVGVVLWAVGTGPIRGFAVVLVLGIFTSMFTALMGTRSLVQVIYGGKRKLDQWDFRDKEYAAKLKEIEKK